MQSGFREFRPAAPVPSDIIQIPEDHFFSGFIPSGETAPGAANGDNAPIIGRTGFKSNPGIVQDFEFTGTKNFFGNRIENGKIFRPVGTGKPQNGKVQIL